MGIWAELGIFGLVFVFCFWQLYDVKKAREATQRQKKREQAQAEADKTADNTPPRIP